MVALADDVGRTVSAYVRQHPGYAMARMRDDAGIAMAQEDWARFQLLERAKLRLLRLQYLSGRYPDGVAGAAVTCPH